jgi:hypothetical protein
MGPKIREGEERDTRQNKTDMFGTGLCGRKENVIVADMIGRPLLDASFQPPYWEPDDPEEFGLRETVLLIGKRRTGKSWMMRDLLNRMRHLYPYGWVFSHTKHNGFYQKFLPNAFIMPEFDPEVVYDIMEMQKSRILRRGQNNEVFIIFDDMAASHNLRYEKMMRELSFNGRHYGITVFFATQRMNAASTAIRDNADRLILFTTNNVKVIEMLSQEFANDFIDKNHFRAFLSLQTEDQQAVIINQRDTTLRGEERYRIYSARDLDHVNFTMLCDHAWNYNRADEVKKQRQQWSSGGIVYKPSYLRKLKNKAKVSTKDNDTTEAKIVREVDPFRMLADS